jgi:hypothetical protein
MGISVPVAWSELPTIEGGAKWSVKNAGQRLAEGNRPWAGYRQGAVSLTAAMKKLSFRAPRLGHAVPGEPAAAFALTRPVRNEAGSGA